MARIGYSLRYLWEKLSKDYDQYVTEKSSAYPEIRHYENFEEALVLGVLRSMADRYHGLAFIEAGAGTGRYMELLGCMTTEELIIRRNESMMYDDKLAKSLRLIVGIDFSERMIDTAKKKIQKITDRTGKGLYDLLVEEGKLKLITKRIEKTSEDMILERKQKRLNRLVCCMFGTFGNISDDDRALALSRMAEWAGDQGVMLLSVFNRDKLGETGYHSYWAVSGLIGTPEIDDKKGNVETKKGFYSHWFDLAELEQIARDHIVTLRHKIIVRGDMLGIANGRQDSRRGLILLASNNQMSWIHEILRGIKGGDYPEDTVREVA